MAHGITAPYRWLLAGLVASLAVVALRPAPRITVRYHLPEYTEHVDAYLISRGTPMPDCGHFAFDTEMTFTDLFADSATRPVRVPCAEMPRPMYDHDAGNAPVLEVGGLYRLELTPTPSGVWLASRIDLLSRPLE